MQSIGIPADIINNRRLNGTTVGIHTAGFLESHGEVHSATSNAMTWVINMIMTLETS